MESCRRVLSIQSHVVSGYCGNKSAVFPLQSLGFEVDFINSVQFSNHTGYKNGWTGQVLNESELLELYEGLKGNGLNVNYTHILTGYARSASFLDAIIKVIKDIKDKNPNALYLCDPVLGDNGKLYVPKELVPIYRDKLILLADIICPNKFEAEILSEVTITDFKTAVVAIDKLHSKGIKTVVITSMDCSSEPNKLYSMVSSVHKGIANRQLYRISMDKLNCNFIGTGDLFAALFLAWFTKTDGDVKKALENVIFTLQAIINRTYRFALTQPGTTTNTSNIELKLIQGIDDIIAPKVTTMAHVFTAV